MIIARQGRTSGRGTPAIAVMICLLAATSCGSNAPPKPAPTAEHPLEVHYWGFVDGELGSSDRAVLQLWLSVELLADAADARVDIALQIPNGSVVHPSLGGVGFGDTVVWSDLRVRRCTDDVLRNADAPDARVSLDTPTCLVTGDETATTLRLQASLPSESLPYLVAARPDGTTDVTPVRSAPGPSEWIRLVGGTPIAPQIGLYAWFPSVGRRARLRGTESPLDSSGEVARLSRVVLAAGLAPAEAEQFTGTWAADLVEDRDADAPIDELHYWLVPSENHEIIQLTASSSLGVSVSGILLARIVLAVARAGAPNADTRTAAPP